MSKQSFLFLRGQQKYNNGEPCDWKKESESTSISEVLRNYSTSSSRFHMIKIVSSLIIINLLLSQLNIFPGIHAQKYITFSNSSCASSQYFDSSVMFCKD